MENSFAKKSKNLSDQELIERIDFPDKFVLEALEAAIEEITERELEGIDYSKVENLRKKLSEKKRKVEENKKALFIKEQQNTKINFEKIQERKFANFGFRAIAFLLDIIFGILIALFIMFFISPFTRVFGEDIQVTINNSLFLIIWFLYFSIFESSDSQATVGKRIFKLKVVDLNGGKLSFWKAAFRFLAKILSGLILGIGFFKSIISSTNQCLHDEIVRTYVIK